MCQAGRASVDPHVVSADQWTQISHALIYLLLFTRLGLTAAICCLLAFGVRPPLAASREANPALNVMRWLSYPLSLAAVFLAAYALARGLSLAVQVAQQLSPRGWI